MKRLHRSTGNTHQRGGFDSHATEGKTKTEITSLTDEIISDANFCAEPVRDPAGILKANGIAANDEVVAGCRGRARNRSSVWPPLSSNSKLLHNILNLF